MEIRAASSGLRPSTAMAPGAAAVPMASNATGMTARPHSSEPVNK